MKLRNKKTGEIAEPFGITCANGRTFVQFDDGKGTFKFEAHSLAELNKEWEDYEEPKEYWFIDFNGEIKEFELIGFEWQGWMKEIGNHFETKEEAKKAVERLRAWKRLKDKGFKFNGWTIDDGLRISICTNTDEDDIYDEDKRRIKPDLDLLFSGGEE